MKAPQDISKMLINPEKKLQNVLAVTAAIESVVKSLTIVFISQTTRTNVTNARKALEIMRETHVWNLLICFIAKCTTQKKL